MSEVMVELAQMELEAIRFDGRFRRALFANQFQLHDALEKAKAQVLDSSKANGHQLKANS